MTLVVTASTVIFLWASSFVAVAIALEDLAPGPLALARYAVASIVFLWFLTVRQCKLPRRGDLIRLAAAGGTGIALYNIALNSGQLTVSAGIASMLVNTVPIWTSLLAMALLRERIGKAGWAGVLLSFVGVSIIALSKELGGGFGIGTLWILGAAFSQAFYFIIIKPLLTRYHPIDLTSYAVWFGCLFLLYYGKDLAESIAHSSLTTQLAVVYLGVGPAALGYVAWSAVLTKLPAGRASNLLYMIPVTAIGMSWMVLGDLPSIAALLGGVIAIIGVAFSNSGKRGAAR